MKKTAKIFTANSLFLAILFIITYTGIISTLAFNDDQLHSMITTQFIDQYRHNTGIECGVKLSDADIVEIVNNKVHVQKNTVVLFSITFTAMFIAGFCISIFFWNN
jgi:hypothetical protein